MNTKQCRHKNCPQKGIEQPVNNFTKHINTKDGLRSYCKVCINREAAIYREKHPKPKSSKRSDLRRIRDEREQYVRNICGDVDLKAINLADFENKKVKRVLEISTASKVKHKGNFLGLTGPAIVEHYNTFGQNLKRNSVFIVAETDENQRTIIEEGIFKLPKEAQNRITLTSRDIFDAAQYWGYSHPHITKPSFTYIHLDFCKTADVLMDDYGLRKKLKQLAKWKHLQKTFYLDISICQRNSSMRTLRNFIGEIIPAAFEDAGWSVGLPDTLNYKDIDGAYMANAFFRISKDDNSQNRN